MPIAFWLQREIKRQEGNNYNTADGRERDPCSRRSCRNGLIRRPAGLSSRPQLLELLPRLLQVELRTHFAASPIQLLGKLNDLRSDPVSHVVDRSND